MTAACRAPSLNLERPVFQCLSECNALYFLLLKTVYRYLLQVLCAKLNCTTHQHTVQCHMQRRCSGKLLTTCPNLSSWVIMSNTGQGRPAWPNVSTCTVSCDMLLSRSWSASNENGALQSPNTIMHVLQQIYHPRDSHARHSPLFMLAPVTMPLKLRCTLTILSSMLCRDFATYIAGLITLQPIDQMDCAFSR